MENQLQIFNFENEGKKLFIFKWNDKIATIAPELSAFEGYENPRKSWLDIKNREEFEENFEVHTLQGEELKEFKGFLKDCNDLTLVVTKMGTTLYQQYKSVPQLDIVYEEGIYGVMYSSGSNHAIKFKKWLRRDVNKAITNTGRYDIVENQIKQIEDEKEKELKLKVYNLEQLIKDNTNDLLLTLTYNNAKSELDKYLSQKQIEEVKDEIKKVEEDLNEHKDKMKQVTALREGDMSAEIIARKFNVFSVNNNPHPLFADNLAKDIGIWQNSRGNAGYQDEFLTIHLVDKGGTTISVTKYSEKAFKLMEEYINENGLRFEEPPKRFSRGDKKGKFNFAYILFENGDRIKVNELTYKLYSKEFNGNS